MRDLSARFSKRELSCRRCGRLQIDSRPLEGLEILRSLTGWPMLVRCAGMSPCPVLLSTCTGGPPREHTDAVDEDLDRMTREQLGAEVVKLRAAIRRHRDSSGHDLCWHHPDLWATLPEHIDPDLAVPPWPKFIRGCIAYRQSLDEQLPGARTHDAEYDEQPR